MKGAESPTSVGGRFFKQISQPHILHYLSWTLLSVFPILPKDLRFPSFLSHSVQLEKSPLLDSWTQGILLFPDVVVFCLPLVDFSGPLACPMLCPWSSDSCGLEPLSSDLQWETLLGSMRAGGERSQGVCFLLSLPVFTVFVQLWLQLLLDGPFPKV